jgi:PAS domain S-box-containing protein
MGAKTSEDPRTKSALLAEIEQLSTRLDEAEQTLDAIRSGEVDALVVTGPHGDRVFSLTGAERTYRLIVETMNEAALTVSLDETILFCNQRFCDLVKTRMADIVGQKLTAFVAPAQHLPLLMLLADAQAGPVQRRLTFRAAGAPVSVQLAASLLVADTQTSICLVASDLTELEAQASSIRVLREHQQALEEIRAELQAANTSLLDSRRSALNVAEDAIVARRQAEETSADLLREVTERKRAEEEVQRLLTAVQEEKDRLSCLLNSISDEVWFADTNGKFTLANPSAVREFIVELTGSVDVEKLAESLEVYRGDGSLRPANDSPPLRALTGEVIRGEDEIIRTPGTGQLRHRQVSSSPVHDAKGHIIGSVSVVRDITEHKKAEELLRAAHERINAILEQMSDGFATFDRDWRYTYINAAAAKAFQMAPEQLLGKSIWEMWPQAHDLPLGVNFRRSLDENVSIRFETYYPAPLDRWFEHRCHPTPEGLVTFFSDITERKHAEEALKELNLELENRVAQRTAELREKDQMLLMQSRQAAMGEMIGNIAHQWRQPLNLLGITVQQLQLYYDVGDFDRTFLVENVEKSMEIIHHMSRTIDDFRNFFKPEKEKVEFKVQNSIAQSMSLLDSQTAHIGVEIIAKDDPVIWGYPNEFAQVVLNILVNAKDALTEREIDNPEITVTISCEDSCATVTVADNAGGIPEEIIDKIFEPYFTTKGPQSGTGLGLFLSKVIIEKNMGGRLSVRNKGNGAEFRIEVFQ